MPFTLNDGTYVYSYETCKEALDKFGFEIEDMFYLLEHADEQKTRINYLEYVYAKANEEIDTLSELLTDITSVISLVADLLDPQEPGNMTKKEAADRLRTLL